MIRIYIILHFTGAALASELSLCGDMPTEAMTPTYRDRKFNVGENIRINCTIPEKSLSDTKYTEITAQNLRFRVLDTGAFVNPDPVINTTVINNVTIAILIPGRYVTMDLYKHHYECYVKNNNLGNCYLDRDVAGFQISDAGGMATVDIPLVKTTNSSPVIMTTNYTGYSFPAWLLLLIIVFTFLVCVAVVIVFIRIKRRLWGHVEIKPPEHQDITASMETLTQTTTGYCSAGNGVSLDGVSQNSSTSSCDKVSGIILNDGKDDFQLFGHLQLNNNDVLSKERISDGSSKLLREASTVAMASQKEWAPYRDESVFHELKQDVVAIDTGSCTEGYVATDNLHYVKNNRLSTAPNSTLHEHLVCTTDGNSIELNDDSFSEESEHEGHVIDPFFDRHSKEMGHDDNDGYIPYAAVGLKCM